MARLPALDAARQTFAEISGALEDAALLACEAQAASSYDEVRRHCDRLIAVVEKCLGRLHQLQRRLE